MKDYLGQFQKAVGMGKKAARPAKSRTMKGRVEDEKEKKQKALDVKLKADSIRRGVEGVGRAAVNALTGKTIRDAIQKSPFKSNLLGMVIDKGNKVNSRTGGGGTNVGGILRRKRARRLRGR